MMEHTDRGKWSHPGVPHAGWVCTYVEDLEEVAAVCGMCESAEIRFVHYMRHADYPDELGVGCVCAEHMEQDYVTPKAREQRLRSRARRRKTWVQRPWRVSAKGNAYLNTEGFNLTVFQQGMEWGFLVKNSSNNKTVFSRRKYQTEDGAKHATLDGLLWAKEHLR